MQPAARPTLTRGWAATVDDLASIAIGSLGGTTGTLSLGAFLLWLKNRLTAKDKAAAKKEAADALSARFAALQTQVDACLASDNGSAVQVAKDEAKHRALSVRLDGLMVEAQACSKRHEKLSDAMTTLTLDVRDRLAALANQAGP